jgi:hypothetical protein
MANPIIEAGYGTRLSATGASVITSGPCTIIGVASYGSATAGIQFFAGTTASASMTPTITFCATASAVAAGLSPMFFRFPAVVSGNGLTVTVLGSLDPNLTLFWLPIS